MTDPSAGVGIFAAMAAGLVSFLSPCVLPLVPGYLSAVIGMSPTELQDARARRVLVPSLAFVLTFSAIFIAMGMAATAIGSTLNEHRQLLERAAAVVIIGMGLVFLLAPRVASLNRTWHVSGLMKRAGRGGPVLAGAAFAIAWTPCIGPTLGAILAAAALTESADRGALLLAFYAAGLAIPFLATALAFQRLTRSFAIVKRHYGALMVIGGLTLIAMGVLIWTGELFQLNIEAQKLLNRLGLDAITEV